MQIRWKDALADYLVKQIGEAKANTLLDKFVNHLPLSYIDDTTAEIAALDFEHLDKLNNENLLTMKLYLSSSTDAPLHLRIYQYAKSIPLSQIMPILANFDLRVDNERQHKISVPNHEICWISDFSIAYPHGDLDISKVQSLFNHAFLNIYFGKAENDGFNKLILAASLTWHEIIILRAYTKYLHQVGFRFSQAYIEQTLATHHDVAKDLILLFFALHDPSQKTSAQATEIENRILKSLDDVKSLDEDRILRRFLILIKVTLRTNYFQRDKDNSMKHYVSLKLSSRDIPELPLPMPLYEIFVYSPLFEAIHLRNSKVARGGIRWSDRPEDFRTEILGLMKAQVVKNAVIVPSGAKGGFVLKTLKPSMSRDEVQQEVIKRYTDFIKGLLDITDNIINNEHTHPAQVVCHDDFDTYLVVAADKGTASFSDLANLISAEYNFWLGDAFASGGSTGYDHKKIGITARGAWESIKRHFRELDIDVTQQDITVVGIGDMSGDVFGNGMLYNKHIKLVGAFNHRHIFIDPNPNPITSYEERERLFKTPGSTWGDYKRELISKGGGVFERSLKSIALTPEMKTVLGTNVDSATPNELIRLVLMAPVDLLFNGGIGTYVKSSTQTQAEVGDRTNDYCRINGNELRCKVVGEGGNLGFTQLGRIEYALLGGLINTDFIDNSGGVDCSDHEVNLKILLNEEIQSGRLSLKDRNDLLFSLTKEVADLVLRDNYEQALVMSFTAQSARKYIGLHANLIKDLEVSGLFNRQVENIPDDKKIMERKAASEGLTRPEIAILLEYSKIYLKHEILKTKLPEDTYINTIVASAFPPSIRSKYASAMYKHRLFRDIVATQLSNKIISYMGITYIHRIHTETGATVDEIIRAFTVATEIFNYSKLRKLIEDLNFKISMTKQYDMLYNVRNLINLATRWFLQSTLLKSDLKTLIDHYTSRIDQLERVIPNLMAGYTRKYLHELEEDFLTLGLSRDTAQHIATYRAIYTSLNIIDVSTRHGFDLIRTAEIYFAAGERVNLLWFRDHINNDSKEGHWNALARLTLRDELDAAQRGLTVAILKNDNQAIPSSQLIANWIEKNKTSLQRWDNLLALLHSSTSLDYSMFFISVRELLSLILRSMDAPRH